MLKEGLLEEKVPGHLAGVGEASLGDVCPDGVDDGGCLLWSKQVCDAPRDDELGDEHQKVVIEQLILVQKEEDSLVLRRK